MNNYHNDSNKQQSSEAELKGFLQKMTEELIGQPKPSSVAPCSIALSDVALTISILLKDEFNASIFHESEKRIYIFFPSGESVKIQLELA